jgi:hypothetical protein
VASLDIALQDLNDAVSKHLLLMNEFLRKLVSYITADR